MGRFTGLLGLTTMIGLAYLFSTNRKAIQLKTVLWGLGLQVSFAFFVLRFELGRNIFQTSGFYVNRLLSYSYVGSELMVVMTSGMAHVSGGIMAAYIAFGIEAKHLLTAVIMTAPGTLLMAKMLVPETEQALTAGKVKMPEMEKDPNVLGAISRGTIDGLHLALNVAAMLVTFLALLALLNAMMGWGHAHLAWFPSSLQQIFGWIFAPVAWVIGVPWKECGAMGNLLGTRMVINELVAFQQLGAIKSTLDPRTFTIATFALCGFANFSSIGIQIGGIGALAPEQRGQLAKFGIRAMLAGTMANLMSAAIVGILT